MSVQLYLKGSLKELYDMQPCIHIQQFLKAAWQRRRSVHNKHIGEASPSSLREPKDKYRPDL